MRLLKIVVGILLVGFGLYVVVGEQLGAVSADAVVNARLTTLRAPISGRVSMPLRMLGARVHEGEPLSAVSDPLADTTQLVDLRRERTKSVAEIRRLESELAAVEASIKRLQGRSQSYKTERIRQLEAQVLASRSLSQAARSQLALYRTILERARRLKGVEPQANLDQAEARAEVAKRELENALAQATVQQVGLDAARKGVFLGEGYNDAPHSEQRLGDLLLRRGEIEAEITAQSEIAAGLERRIASEQLLVNRRTTAAINSNVNGILWTLKATNGETVQRGQDMLQLVDCDSTVVTLSVSESVYNTLTVGTEASFRMTSRSRVFDGTVIRLAGAGAGEVYRNLAVAPSREHLERFDVTLAVPSLVTDEDARCQIGRTGRVFFDRDAGNWLSSFWR